MLEAQPETIEPTNLKSVTEKIRPHLGLVCITSNNEVRFRIITRTRYLKLTETERRNTLKELYQDNLKRLNKALTYCAQNRIKLYRMSSQLFPMSDLVGDPTGPAVLAEMRDELAEIGKESKRLDIRVVMHPDQFVVLNSERPDVVTASIKVMQRHADTLDLMGLPVSSWTAMTIHGGKGGKSDQMVAAIRELPDSIRLRLTLENDEHAYGANEILDICHRTGVPMVFDVHHHIVHDKLDTLSHPSIAQQLAAARETWANPQWQLVHLSNGRDAFSDPAHHDFITDVPAAFENAPWIEVEAKAKEQAIEQLRSIWPVAE